MRTPISWGSITPSYPLNSMAAPIEQSFDEFHVCVIGGDANLLKEGWYYHPGPGGTMIYGTRGKEAIGSALARGYRLSDSAKRAFASWNDDPCFAANKERERLELCAQIEADRKKENEARESIVNVARQKLTDEEFEAIIETGRLEA